VVFSSRLPVFLFVLFSCAEGTARREARSLVDTVERFRRAENDQKPAMAAVVSGVACTDAEVCAAKKACVEAIDPTARALALKDEVARALDDLAAKKLDPRDTRAQALPQKLDDAERLLNEGRAKMPACEQKIAELKVKHGV
jgi:hypothetical protein